MTDAATQAFFEKHAFFSLAQVLGSRFRVCPVSQFPSVLLRFQVRGVGSVLFLGYPNASFGLAQVPQYRVLTVVVSAPPL